MQIKSPLPDASTLVSSVGLGAGSAATSAGNLASNSPPDWLSLSSADTVDLSDGSDSTSSSSSSISSSSSSTIPVNSASVASAAYNLEMLFENYLNEVEWLAAEVEDEIDEIRNTEENVVLQLDLLRNRILRFELLLSISSFVVTCGALVTGLFGMNLLSHLETKGSVFYVVSAFLAMSMTSLFIIITRYGRKEKLF